MHLATVCALVSGATGATSPEASTKCPLDLPADEAAAVLRQFIPSVALPLLSTSLAPVAPATRETVELSAFVVTSEENAGDYGASSMSGTRMNTKLEDNYVPYGENGAPIQRQYDRLGGTFELIMNPGVDHHPHGLSDPTPVVDFIEKHTH